MKDELNLFYQMWNMSTQISENTADIRNLSFFTKFDLFVAAIVKNPLYRVFLLIAIVCLFMFLFLFVIIFFIIYLSKTSTPHSREKLRLLENIYIGIDAYNNKNYKEALSIFETLNAVISKNDLEFNSWLFYCYFNTGNYQKAIELFNYRSTNNERVKLLLCYYKLDNIQAMIDSIQQRFFASEIYNNPLILAILGTALYKQNVLDIAIEKLSTYSTTGKLFNNDNCAFLYTLAKCKEATGDKSGAQADFKTIFAFNPNFMDVKDILASY